VALFREVTSVRHGRSSARDDFFDAAEVTEGHLSSGSQCFADPQKRFIGRKFAKANLKDR
jgi:hypothetical protein